MEALENFTVNKYRYIGVSNAYPLLIFVLKNFWIVHNLVSHEPFTAFGYVAHPVSIPSVYIHITSYGFLL